MRSRVGTAQKRNLLLLKQGWLIFFFILFFFSYGKLLFPYFYAWLAIYGVTGKLYRAGEKYR